MLTKVKTRNCSPPRTNDYVIFAAHAHSRTHHKTWLIPCVIVCERSGIWACVWHICVVRLCFLYHDFVCSSQHFQAQHLFNHPKNDAGSPLTRVRERKIEKSNVKTTNFVKYDNTENIVTLSRHIVSRPKVVNSQVIYWICFRVYFFQDGYASTFFLQTYTFISNDSSAEWREKTLSIQQADQTFGRVGCDYRRFFLFFFWDTAQSDERKFGKHAWSFIQGDRENQNKST